MDDAADEAANVEFLPDIGSPKAGASSHRFPVPGQGRSLFDLLRHADELNARKEHCPDNIGGSIKRGNHHVSGVRQMTVKTAQQLNRLFAPSGRQQNGAPGIEGALTFREDGGATLVHFGEFGMFVCELKKTAMRRGQSGGDDGARYGILSKQTAQGQLLH